MAPSCCAEGGKARASANAPSGNVWVGIEDDDVDPDVVIDSEVGAARMYPRPLWLWRCDGDVVLDWFELCWVDVFCFNQNPLIATLHCRCRPAATPPWAEGWQEGAAVGRASAETAAASASVVLDRVLLRLLRLLPGWRLRRSKVTVAAVPPFGRPA